MEELFNKLQYAKGAVLQLVDEEGALIDFHDLVYWAGEVMRLRAEIKKLL